MSQLQRYEFSEQGIRHHSEGVEITHSWDKITYIKTTRDFLLCFIGQKNAYYIPVDLLSDSEIQQIYSWRNAGT